MFIEQGAKFILHLSISVIHRDDQNLCLTYINYFAETNSSIWNMVAQNVTKSNFIAAIAGAVKPIRSWLIQGNPFQGTSLSLTLQCLCPGFDGDVWAEKLLGFHQQLIYKYKYIWYPPPQDPYFLRIYWYLQYFLRIYWYIAVLIFWLIFCILKSCVELFKRHI